MPDSQTLSEPLAIIGKSGRRAVRLSRDEIADFARITSDSVPLHHPTHAVQRARRGEIIASAEHTTALRTGLASSHFSRAGDGFSRELLCLDFNFAFKPPVFAEQQLSLSWQVASVEPHAVLGGLLVQVDGRAAVHPAVPGVVGRGTLLIKARPV